ncbi:MAG: glutamyl-tRNA reductase [Porphyromonadaceae bacterium]|nr:glutamyl-tRNA reductase [Porphyromonadaceae bacterium]
MSIVVVSISHRHASFDLLERVTLTANEASALAQKLTELDHVRESLTLATCNRVEVFLASDAPDRAVDAVVEQLAQHGEIDAAFVNKSVQVFRNDDAVSHAFRLAAGLESMVQGEGQVLGQLRDALTRSQLDDTVGTELNSIVQKALKAGKRAHAETDIDRFAPSIVAAALDQAAAKFPWPPASFLVAGAGTMSVLAVRTLIDRGINPANISVANRAHGRALDLAEEHGVQAVRWEDLDTALVGAHALITCTGAADVIFDEARLAAAVAARAEEAVPFVVLDLALPRDVASGVRSLENVEVIDLESLSGVAQNADRAAALADVESIVEWDIAAHLAERRQESVTPTVVALHDRARDVVDSEYARIEPRLADLDPQVREDVKDALQRVARKLIHEPTMRLKSLAATSNGQADLESLTALLLAEKSAQSSLLEQVGERS